MITFVEKPQEILGWLTRQLPAMAGTLETFVRAESPSTEKTAADHCARLIATRWKERGVPVELFEQKHRGAHIRITKTPVHSKPRGQILVLGHYDTVYASGTLTECLFESLREEFTVGVFDMKAGIVQALFALDAIQRFHAGLSKRIIFLGPRREIGSESSRKLLEAEAKRSDAVFVLEPSLGPKGG
jgi:glutamate carboxypeptidase